MGDEMGAAYHRLSERIAEAARRSHRDPNTIQWVVVSKGIEAPAIHEAASAGARLFGENRVQEALQKFTGETIQSLRHVQPALSLHLIGSLQSNKVKKAVRFFDLIHSIDSRRLAEDLADEAARQSWIQPILVQVNVSGEKTKRGVPLQEASLLVAHVRSLPSLRLEGLMTIPPRPLSAEASRPYFAKLREFGHALGVYQFSMGMSDDFEVAIEEGATWVRIGTAFFGASISPLTPRPSSK